MKKIIISICLIIIFFLIFFSYNTYENFNFSVQKTKYIPQYVGPILFYDYNDNIIGTYPDDKIWPNFFEKKIINIYLNMLGLFYFTIIMIILLVLIQMIKFGLIFLKKKIINI